MRLDTLQKWASTHGVSLDNAEINGHTRRLTFRQTYETRANFRAVKRAVENFESNGRPPYVELRKAVKLTERDGNEVEWTVIWDGAFQCNVSYDCQAARFQEDPEPVVEPLHEHRSA